MTSFRIEKLGQHHLLDGFDCGEKPLDRFLSRFAWPTQLANASQTYVALADSTVVGYYTLVVAEVAYEDAPDRLSKGLARRSVPLMLLARLAVDRQWQGKGLGSGLLKDAMVRTIGAADIAGIRAMAVHAKHESAKAFYEHFDFVPSPTDPLHLYLLVKDVKRIINL